LQNIFRLTEAFDEGFFECYFVLLVEQVLRWGHAHAVRACVALGRTESANLLLGAESVVSRVDAEASSALYVKISIFVNMSLLQATCARGHFYLEDNMSNRVFLEVKVLVSGRFAR
jgi:hypothetical protein